MGGSVFFFIGGGGRGGGGGGGGAMRVNPRFCCDMYVIEVFERSRSASSPLENTRLKLANPVELTGFERG